MNRIYSLVWSAARGGLVVVSERAKSQRGGKAGLSAGSVAPKLLAGALMCMSVLGTSAFSQTTNWATWALPSTYPLPNIGVPNIPGFPSSSINYATGVTGSVLNPVSNRSIGLTLSGEVNSYSGPWYGTQFPTLDPSYLSSFVATGPQNSTMVAQTGYTLNEYKAHTVRFSEPVSNVLMAVTSLGGNGVSSLQFTNPFTILSSNNSPSREALWYGASTTAPAIGTTAGISASSQPFSGSSTTGYFLSGMEGYGVLQFQGTFSELSWTVTAPEFYSGFTLGFTSNPMSTSAALPDPYSFAPGVLPPAFTASIRPINASNDVVSGLGTVTSRVFDGGTLILAANNADAFTITNLGGAMNVATGAVTASGVISNEGLNSGMLKKTGAGRLVLSASNTYSGGTTVEAGTLQISTMDNLGSGPVALNGGTLAVTETIATNRAMSLGTNNGTLDVASGKALTVSGEVSGSGALNKTSAGSLILSGTNTHTGTVGVNQGTLVLNGSTASSVMTVSAGAVLTGSGSTAGRVVLAGSVKPGNSPGTLSVAGDFAMSAGSSFDAELDGRTYSAAGGAGSYDRIALTGASGVFTAAGTLNPVLRAISAPANNNFSPIVGDAFRVVTTANATGVSTSGAFSAVADPSAANGMPANTRFDVIYGSNFIDLVLTPNQLEEFAKPYGVQNMVNAARAFDGIRPAQGARGTSDKQQFFNGLYGHSADALARSVLQSSGEIHAFALSDARHGWQASTKAVGSVAGVKAERNLWVDVSGDDRRHKQDAYASAYNSNATHLWIGTHVYEHKDVQLGLAGGASTHRINSASSGSANLDSQAMALYAIGQKGAFDYSAVFSLNTSTIGTKRQTSLSTGAQSNPGDSRAAGQVFSITAGFKHALSANINGRAWINGLVDQTRAKAFSEQGSSVTALGVASESFKSAQATVGYSISGSFNVPDNRPGVWLLGVGVTHQLEQGRPQVSRQMSMHGANWQVTAPKLGTLTQFAQAGVRVPLSANVDAWANIDASERQGASAKGGNVGLSIKW
jgi:autotransporter-associated beta strand protein